MKVPNVIPPYMSEKGRHMTTMRRTPVYSIGIVKNFCGE